MSDRGSVLSKVASEEDFSGLKLADEFINVIDFHADYLTGLSHSSGTVSYDSIPNANGRVDRHLHRMAKHCVNQPPRPHGKAKTRKILNENEMVKKTTIDLDCFKKIRREMYRRSTEITIEKHPFRSWNEINTKVDNWMDECLMNAKKSDNDKTKNGLSEISFDIPKDTSHHNVVTKTTISLKLFDEMRRNVPPLSSLQSVIHYSQWFNNVEKTYESL